MPKYRFRILTGRVSEEVDRCIRAFTEQQKAEVVELNVQIDHVHLLVMIPPKKAVSDFVGTVKGRTAIRVFNKFRELKRKPYWAIISGLEATVWIRLAWMKTRYARMCGIRKRRSEKQSRVVLIID